MPPGTGTPNLDTLPWVPTLTSKPKSTSQVAYR